MRESEQIEQGFRVTLRDPETGESMLLRFPPGSKELRLEAHYDDRTAPAYAVLAVREGVLDFDVELALSTDENVKLFEVKRRNRDQFETSPRVKGEGPQQSETPLTPETAKGGSKGEGTNPSAKPQEGVQTPQEEASKVESATPPTKPQEGVQTPQEEASKVEGTNPSAKPQEPGGGTENTKGGGKSGGKK